MEVSATVTAEARIPKEERALTKALKDLAAKLESRLRKKLLAVKEAFWVSLQEKALLGKRSI